MNWKNLTYYGIKNYLHECYKLLIRHVQYCFQFSQRVQCCRDLGSPLGLTPKDRSRCRSTGSDILTPFDLPFPIYCKYKACTYWVSLSVRTFRRLITSFVAFCAGPSCSIVSWVGEDRNAVRTLETSLLSLIIFRLYSRWANFVCYEGYKFTNWSPLSFNVLVWIRMGAPSVI